MNSHMDSSTAIIDQIQANYVLDDHDRRLVTSSLKSMRSRLSATSKQRSAAPGGPHSTERQRLLAIEDSLIRSTQMLVDILAPSFIAHLPNELLCEVFLAYLDIYHEEAVRQSPFEPDATLPITALASAPFTLLQVCKRWNVTVAQDARLWKHISVVVPRCRTVADLNATALSGLSTRAQRAGGTPLSFVLNAYDDEPLTSVLACYEENIRPILGRCSHIKLILSFPALQGLGIQTIASFPELQSLNIHITYRGDAFDNGALQHILACAPQLQRLEYAGAQGGGSAWVTAALQSAKLRLTLRHLVASHTRLSLDMFLLLLENFPVLESLHIGYVGLDVFHDPVPAPHTRLAYLTMSSLNDQRLLDAMTLPSLTSLTFARTDKALGDAYWPSANALSFMARSQCVLTELCIAGLHTVTSGFRQLLASQRSLRKLELSHGAMALNPKVGIVSSTTLQALFDRSVCPALEELTVLGIVGHLVPHVAQLLRRREHNLRRCTLEFTVVKMEKELQLRVALKTDPVWKSRPGFRLSVSSCQSRYEW